MEACTLLLLCCFSLVQATFPKMDSAFSAHLHSEAVPKEYIEQQRRMWLNNEMSEYPYEAYLDYKELKEKALATNFMFRTNVEPQTFEALTSDCDRDFRRYVNMLNRTFTPPWAWLMFDSTSFFEPGISDGNFVFEGRYQVCIEAKEENSLVEEPIEALYCMGYWYENFTHMGWQKRGQGICIPNTCTNKDAEILIRDVYVPYAPDHVYIQIHCERGNDISEDAEAIISIIILCMFGLLCLIATLYDAYLKQGKCNQEEEECAKPQHVAPSSKDIHDDSNYTKLQDVKQNGSVDHGELSNGHLNNGYVADGKIKSDLPSYTSVEMMKMNETGQQIATEADEKVLTLRQPQDTSASDTVKETKGKGFELDEKQTPVQTTSIPEQMLLAFSMYTCFPLITTTKQAKGVYKCLNGIRFLAMAWIILGHTYVIGTMEFPTTIENEFTAYSKWTKPSYSKLIEIDVYVDTFFILSAFLVTVSFLRKLNKADGIRKIGLLGMIMHYFNRYWRLTPTYFVILMIYTNLFHYFGEGPFMKNFLYDVDTCSTEWWRNLLYINNLFMDSANGFCFGWSWYLCVDWQLFCVAPLFIYFLWRYEIFGIILSCLGFCVGIISNVVLYHKLYTQTADTENRISDFDDIYIKPWCRCHVYFMGILLGYLFYKTNGKIKMHWTVVSLGWFVALASSILVCYLPILQYCQDSDACGPWTQAGLVAWNTLNRPIWGIWVCWLVLACSTGYGGFVDIFLSWNFFVPLSKLSFLGYLIHPIFCYLFFFGAPIQQYYSDYFFIYVFMGHLMLTMVCSLVMATTVSAPLMGIMAVFLPSMRGKERR